MFRRGDDPRLQTFDHFRRACADEVRIFGIALIRAAPAIIAGHRDDGGEAPIDSGNRHLRRRDVADAANQLEITRRPEADVVREDRRADDVAVAVDAIRSPDDRNCLLAAGRIHRRVVERVGQGQPVIDARVAIVVRPGPAAVEDGTEVIGADVGRSDGGDTGLNDLSDFFLHAHPRQEIVDAL